MASYRRRGGRVPDWVKTLVQVVILALLVRTFAFEPFNIPSKSMLPTLVVGDLLVVSKFSYGYSRHILPFGLPGWEGRIFAKLPQRGEVAVFTLPNDGHTVIKRVIGLPGDHVQVRHRVLFINDVPVKRQQVEDYVDRDPNSGTRRYPQYIETLPQGAAHIIIENPGPEGEADNTEEYVVPERHYFMMGDNRDSSEDSRFLDKIGYVPEGNLVGRAEVVFLSTEPAAKPKTWPGRLRWDRVLMKIL